MSSAMLQAPPRLFASPQGAPVGGRRVTLEERLQATWRAAQRGGSADCPVCGAAMYAEAAKARCGRCDSVVI